MNPTERYSFDRRTQEILENLTIPFAIYQYIDKRVVTIALSKGFCDQFGFKRLEDAYHAMPEARLPRVDGRLRQRLFLAGRPPEHQIRPDQV